MDAREFAKHIRTGQLSVDEIGRGMHKSYRNARHLVEDAETLLEKRPGRAISLAVLALEETAKVILLADAAIRAVNGPVNWTTIQEELKLRSHQHKQATLAAYGRSLLDKFASDDGSETYYENQLPTGIPPLLDLIKQFGFYVDAAEGQFIDPDEFGRENSDWAEWLITAAKERIQSLEALHGTEQRSITIARRAAEFVAMVVASDGDQNKLADAVKEFVRKQRATT
jgi:AbiV family abortive infection protein